MHRITLTKQKKLNLQKSPCNEDPVYSFTTCVKEQLSQRIGCRLPWDKWSDQSCRTCESESEFKQFEKNYTSLALADFDDIVDTVGCMKPCTYNMYQFGRKEPSMIDFDSFSFSFWAASTKTIIRTEQLIYPLTSLVAEFGGTLGLFLGVSFITLWDNMFYLGRMCEMALKRY